MEARKTEKLSIVCGRPLVQYQNGPTAVQRKMLKNRKPINITNVNSAGIIRIGHKLNWHEN